MPYTYSAVGSTDSDGEGAGSGVASASSASFIASRAAVLIAFEATVAPDTPSQELMVSSVAG